MRRLVGYVRVDSGCITLVDPCYVARDPGEAPYGQAERVKTGLAAHKKRLIAWEEFVGGPEAGHARAGLTVGCFGGDGVYPVHVDVDQDRLVRSVTIEFTPTEETTTGPEEPCRSNEG